MAKVEDECVACFDWPWHCFVFYYLSGRWPIDICSTWNVTLPIKFNFHFFFCWVCGPGCVHLVFPTPLFGPFLWPSNLLHPFCWCAPLISFLLLFEYLFLLILFKLFPLVQKFPINSWVILWILFNFPYFDFLFFIFYLF